MWLTDYSVFFCEWISPLTMVDPFAILQILPSHVKNICLSAFQRLNKCFRLIISSNTWKWIWLRQDEMEKPKAEVVQEKPKASVGWVEPSNSLTISLSLEDRSCASCAMSFQSMGKIDVTFFVVSILGFCDFYGFSGFCCFCDFCVFSGFCGCSGLKSKLEHLQIQYSTCI